MNVLLVGLGGGAGAILRYWLGTWVQDRLGTAQFPYGTLVVNVAGCLVIGLLGYWGEARQVFTLESRLLIFTGVLGGFTTFSAFGAETMELARKGAGGLAVANVAASVVLGLAGVWAGRLIGRWIWG